MKKKIFWSIPFIIILLGYLIFTKIQGPKFEALGREKFFFKKAFIQGEFSPIFAVGNFIPPIYSPLTLEELPSTLLLFEDNRETKILVNAPGLPKPMLYNEKGNFLSFVNRSFDKIKAVRISNKNILVASAGKELLFFVFQKKSLLAKKKLSFDAFIYDFIFTDLNGDGQEELLLVLRTEAEGYILAGSTLKGKLLFQKNFKNPLKIKGVVSLSNGQELAIILKENENRIIALKANSPSLESPLLIWQFGLNEDTRITAVDFDKTAKEIYISTANQEKNRGRIFALALDSGRILNLFPKNGEANLAFTSLICSNLDSDGKIEVVASAAGQSGQILILGKNGRDLKVKRSLIYKRLAYPPTNEVNVYLLSVDNFVSGSKLGKETKELLVYLTYENRIPNSSQVIFSQGWVVLLSRRLREIADLELEGRLSNWAVFKSQKKEQLILIIADNQLRFYE